MDENSVTALAMDPNQKWIAFGDKKGILRIWNLVDNNLKHEFPSEDDDEIG